MWNESGCSVSALSVGPCPVLRQRIGAMKQMVQSLSKPLKDVLDNNAVRWSLAIFLTLRIGLSALAVIVISLRPLPEGGHERYVASFGLSPVSAPAERLLLEVWQRWDVLHYQRIAAHGYTDDESTAFYPSYPALVRLLGSILGGNHLLAGIAICSLAFPAALTLLSKLTEQDLGEEVAQRTTLYISVFPTAFFFFVPYPEALFLLLILVAFYAARHGHWVAASVSATLASVTRMPGVLLLLPPGYEYLEQTGLNLRRVRWQALLLPLILLPPLAFLWFRHLAGYPSPSDLAYEYWHLIPGPPWQDLVNLWRLAVSRQITVKHMLDAVISIPFLCITAAGFSRIRVSYRLYVASTLLLLFTIVDPSQPLVDLPRHVWICSQGS